TDCNCPQVSFGRLRRKLGRSQLKRRPSGNWRLRLSKTGSKLLPPGLMEQRCRYVVKTTKKQCAARSRYTTNEPSDFQPNIRARCRKREKPISPGVSPLGSPKSKRSTRKRFTLF